MARTPSVIITPVERIALIFTIKAQIKEIKADIKAFAIAAKERVKIRIAEDKAIAKADKALQQDRQREDKINEGHAVARDKRLAILEGKLAALVNQTTTPTPKPASAATSRVSAPVNVPVDSPVAAPVDSPVKRIRRTKAEMEAARAAAA